MILTVKYDRRYYCLLSKVYKGIVVHFETFEGATLNVLDTVPKPFRVLIYKTIPEGTNKEMPHILERRRQENKHIANFGIQMTRSRFITPAIQARLSNGVIEKLYKEGNIKHLSGSTNKLIIDRENIEMDNDGYKIYDNGFGHYTDLEDYLLINTICLNL